jgi:hypothetical protein
VERDSTFSSSYVRWVHFFFGSIAASDTSHHIVVWLVSLLQGQEHTNARSMSNLNYHFVRHRSNRGRRFSSVVIVLPRDQKSTKVGVAVPAHQLEFYSLTP